MGKADRYQKLYPVTWDQLHRDAKALAWRLLEQGPFKGIIGVARGGLVPAAIVARELNIRLVDTLCICTYQGREQTGGEEVLKAIEGDGDGWLVVDDLVDTGNTATWIADDLKLIEDRRKVSQLLTHDTLPATGMSMEYHVVTSDTTAVGKQETEGSELSFGKVTFGTKTADINTYGGYTSLSRQTIERSTTPMLNTAITALQNAYAKATEKAVRDHLYAEIKAQRDASSNANKIDAPQLANMTIDDWVSLIIDASELADDRNVSLTRLAVSKDVLKALVKLKDTGDRFFNLSGDGSDTIGSFDLTGVAGTFMRVPVVLLPNADAGLASFIDPASVTVWESGGPAQLTDGDVTGLTNSYSVYGYMAVATTYADGLIPVKFATA